MHPLMNQLIQLQELIVIRDEQKVAGESEHLERLDASIKTMIAELPPPTRLLHGKLFSKDHNVLSPVSSGICAVCGMKLPISLVQAVRLGREVHSCPNCARMLYYQDVAARRLAEAARKIGPRKVRIVRFSSEALMIPNLVSGDRDGVIAEMAYQMANEGFVDKAEPLIEEALRREALVSTAMNHGLALPHVRGVEGGGLTLALGLSAKGIKFDPARKVVSRMIFFIVIPTAASAFYLKLLAGLAETFSDSEARKSVQECKDAATMWKTLIKVTRATIK